MNRIILLGNGFDLAHGLPTTYKDFVFNYMYEVVNKREHHDKYIDYINNQMGVSFSKVTSIKEILDIINNKRGIVCNFENPFLNSALNNLSLNNWIDLEMHYYSILKNYINWGHGKIRSKGDLKAYNDSFELVKKLLEEYLVENVKNLYSSVAYSNFINIFNQDILQKDFSITNLVENTKPGETLFLNFNYTDTIKPYLKNFENARLINIHGELQSTENPIVFGFGDELDIKYAEIENLNEDELFKHIKSFMYLQSSNYHNLTRFVESMEFQVFVMGHSCGLSDRTMLNYIFEHKNCKSIKIFYHANKDSFITTTHEISRHFKNKSAMRMKIVPFDKSEPCPQVQLEKIKK